MLSMTLLDLSSLVVSLYWRCVSFLLLVPEPEIRFEAALNLKRDWLEPIDPFDLSSPWFSLINRSLAKLKSERALGV